ncbi:DUF192 domain-containing protein [Polynucleobacter sp. 30F-ANTBAC]|uniref:DUF192 domain-containing protein n=1 Tax=Polynucleobacter sp. 30F-ANTBAC TaxID=2689095 RepID=UPI001C0AB7EA|nr:DUF192 domain-containing protein [Polynucleobacter sp. 30F-ANTBAC]
MPHLARLLISALFIYTSHVGGISAQSMPRAELQVGLHKITAEVASNQAERQLGLMNRNFLPSDEGMLFIFESTATHCFWMRNTKIPLSIAFIDQSGEIVNIEEMQAMTETNHCPSKPIRFALEMNQAWFSKKDILPGHTVSGLPKR